ncbi:26718_t:CDS:2, partial [Gigaspora margarita]
MSWIPAFTEEIKDPISIVKSLESQGKQENLDPPLKPITISIVGAGQRGSLYANYAKIEPKWAQIVAVAEPVEHRRNMMAQLYNIPKENVFADWEEMIKRPKLSDAVVIATLDDLHVKPAVEFAKQKYHILLEKPIAMTIQGCMEITNAVLENEIIEAGFLGNIVNIQHMEPVGFWHFAHSYVRGNWRNEKTSNFSLMTKKISSFGSLMHFNSENKPKAADIEHIETELKNGPYGRCVYESDNDVMDNQVVNLEFANGSTANITMIAYTEAITERK